MTNNYRVVSLADQLLEITEQLQDAVQRQEPEPQEWISLLEERQKVMEQISDFLSEGKVSSESVHVHTIRKAFEIHQRILPQMETKFQGVQKQLSTIQKTKLARHTYYDNGPSGYGAFFDRKK
jgi:hypothetical protein